MAQIAAGRAVAHAMPVDVKNEAIVGADSNDIGRRRGIEVQGLHEVKNDGFAERSRGMRDPRGSPVAMGGVWLGRCLGLKANRREGESQGDEN